MKKSSKTSSHKLELRRETIRALTPGDLANAAGGLMVSRHRVRTRALAEPFTDIALRHSV